MRSNVSDHVLGRTVHAHPTFEIVFERHVHVRRSVDRIFVRATYDHGVDTDRHHRGSESDGGSVAVGSDEAEPALVEAKRLIWRLHELAHHGIGDVRNFLSESGENSRGLFSSSSARHTGLVTLLRDPGAKAWAHTSLPRALGDLL